MAAFSSYYEHDSTASNAIGSFINLFEESVPFEPVEFYAKIQENYGIDVLNGECKDHWHVYTWIPATRPYARRESKSRYDMFVNWLDKGPVIPGVNCVSFCNPQHDHSRGQYLGDMTRVWDLFPNLEHLTLQGKLDSLGEPIAIFLKSMELFVNVQNAEAFRGILDGMYPSLEGLYLNFQGTERQILEEFDFSSLQPFQNVSLSEVEFSFSDSWDGEESKNFLTSKLKNEILSFICRLEHLNSLILKDVYATGDFIRDLAKRNKVADLKRLQIGIGGFEQDFVDVILDHSEVFEKLEFFRIYQTNELMNDEVEKLVEMNPNFKFEPHSYKRE